MVTQPHYLLFCDTHVAELPSESLPPNYVRRSAGRWHFVLERLDGPERLEAADCEHAVNRERLALLSVVRGLEALEQPSQVTLVTTSRYVSRGLRYGLSTWREADYKWERFGERKPIRNSDLWRRVDTALQFHGVRCRLIQPALSETTATAQTTVAPETMRATPVAPWAAEATERLLSQRGQVADIWPVALTPQHANLQSAGLLADDRSATEFLARDMRGSPTFGRRQASALRNGVLSSWWQLALAWMRWWRRRTLAQPHFQWSQGLQS